MYRAAFFFAFAREDQNDLAGDSGFLGPNDGGQNYDVEFLGVALDSSRMHITIVTGQRPDNGLTRYSPGDIHIVANNGSVYGIEVGGGAGGAAGGLSTEGAAGSTYVLNSSGFTISHAVSALSVGSIWRDPNWLLDPIPPATQVQLQASGGTLVGTADFVYTRDTSTSQHSIIELSLDRSIFGSATEIDIYWGPSCGNDVLLVHDDVPRIPEPATLPLLGLGVAGLIAARRKRR